MAYGIRRTIRQAYLIQGRSHRRAPGAESATARQDVKKIRENVARELAAANDQLMAKNHALAQALSRAGKELTKAKAQLSQMAQPPKTFATMVKVDSSMTDELGVQHASAEILTAADGWSCLWPPTSTRPG